MAHGPNHSQSIASSTIPGPAFEGLVPSTQTVKADADERNARLNKLAPDTAEALRYRSKLLRESVERNKQHSRKLQRETNEATRRIEASERERRTAARRARDAERKRRERAGEIAAKRINALNKFTLLSSTNRFAEKLVGRGEELAHFRDAIEVSERFFGAKRTDSKIAKVYRDITGQPMTKRQAQNRRNAVAKLEQPGQPWHRWR